MKKSSLLALGCLALLLFATTAFSQPPAQTPAPADTRKHTSLGKYCTALEAYMMWRTKPKEVKILDVRTTQEYDVIGHAQAAPNIPVKVFTNTFNAEKKAYDMADNPDFVAQVSKLFGKEDTILVMCRSGQRAAIAVNLLAQAGYVNVYNIVDGFEGDTISDPENVFNGKRMKNGWKNTGLPWTYALDPALVHSK